MKTRTWSVVAAALTLGAVGAMALSGTKIPTSDRTIVWKDPDAPRRIRAHASAIEKVARWPGLADFLVAVAYIESRGNSQAGSSDPNSNAARGWYGIRPESGRAGELGLHRTGALKDEAAATAIAAWYAHRMRAQASPGQVVDWLAVRRGWGYPKDVRDTDHAGYWKQLGMGLKAAGVPADFMLDPAFERDYAWPGMDAVLAASRGAYA